MKILLTVLLLLVLPGQMGCRQPKNCPGTAGTARCTQEGLPQWCDEGERWRSWATLPCSATGGSCVIRNGYATCTRMTDAGVSHD